MPQHRADSQVLRRACSGFTLIELLVAMSASTVLLGAMGSMIVLTARAIPTGEGRGSVAANASHVLQRMCDDLQFAQRVTIGTQEMQLLVPDRTGDGIADPVTYWLSAGVLYKGTSRADINPYAVMKGISGFSITPDTSVRVLRAVQLSLVVDEIGIVETSAETLARPPRP